MNTARQIALALILLIPLLFTPTMSNRMIIMNTGDITLSNSRVQIESSLLLELTSTKKQALADGQLVKALLEFDHELSSNEIRDAELYGVSFARRGSSIIHIGRVYSAKIPSASTIQALELLGLVRASSGSKQFYPSLTTSVPAIKAPDVWENLQVDGKSIDGTGTLVAVIDTGISWLHPSFWRPSTSPLNVIQSGSDYYLDIDNDSIADADEGPINCIEGSDVSSISIATDYLYIDINNNDRFDFTAGERWLGGVDSNHDGIITLPDEDAVILGESKVAYLYDQYTGNVYVRGVNLTDAAFDSDPHGHGTHVASTIAGGQPGYTSMVGVAPGADLLIVKSPLDSASILDAIHFAVSNDADVINMSFSSYLGFLDGTDIEDLAISEAFRIKGVLSTLAAGNLGGRPKHAMFIVNSGTTGTATLSVNNPPQYSFVNILWHSNDDDEHILLTSPSDDELDLGSFKQNKNKAWSISTSEINAYVFFDESQRGINRVIIQISASDYNWSSGNWRLSLYNPSGSAVTVHAYAWDGAWAGSGLRFLSQVTSQYTISSPGTADLGVTVTSYDESTHDASPSSSLGPRIDGVEKPQVIAPGVSIRAALNSLSNLWTTRSGTSMAAPHVAGALALIKQASGAADAWVDYTALIQGAGGANKHYSEANFKFGYGLVNTLWSVQHALNQSIDAEINLNDWAGISPLITDSEDPSIKENHDIISVYAYMETDTVNIGVELRGAPDLSDGTVLSFYWDNDNSESTGNAGVDYLVNITQSGAMVYEWSGSQFIPSSLVASTWVGDSALFLSLKRPNSLLGSASVATHNTSLADIDSTEKFTLKYQWRPLVTGLNLTIDDGNLTATLRMYDRDNPPSDFSINWDFVAGDFTTVYSSSVSGQSVITVNIPNYIEDLGLPLDGVSSLIFSVKSLNESYSLPPLLLSLGAALEIKITSAYLDSNQIRVGPLISESITGKIIIEGYSFVESVKLGLKASYGLWLNFTLSGSEGVYNIDVSPSSLSAGTYEVYAIVSTQFDTTIESQFEVLVIVEDYSNLVLIIAGAFTLIISVKIIQSLAKRRSK